MAALLHIILFRDRGQRDTRPAKLARVADDDLGVTFIFFDLAMHLDPPSGQGADVAHVTEVRRKNCPAKRAARMVGTEVNVLDAIRALSYLRHFCGDASGRADTAIGLLWRNAGGAGNPGKTKDQRETTSSAPSVAHH